MGLMLAEPAFLAKDFAAPQVCAPATAPERANRPFDLPRWLIGKIDWALRRFYGVREFSERDDCLLRIASSRVTKVTWLADGSRLSPGTQIIDLHLWNERLLTLPPKRRGLSRAVALRRQIENSLAELARHVEKDASLHNISAIRAQTALVPRRRIRKLRRVALAFGFEEPVSTPHNPIPLRLARLCENIFVCALAWTFNPAALARNGLRRQHCELWMSRSALVAMHSPREENGQGATPLIRALPRYPFLKFGAAVKERQSQCRRTEAAAASTSEEVNL